MKLKNLTVINPFETLENKTIEIDGECINTISNDDEGIDLSGHYILPGFIDIHIHGCDGVDVMDKDTLALNTMITNLPKEGTTSFLATTLTEDYDSLINAMQVVNDTDTSMFGAEMLGVHLEGPFISKSFKGAQNEKYIVNPEIKLLKEFNEKSGNQIKVVTYAVEEASLEFTKYLKSMGIIPSVGHSGASFEQVMNHVSNGLSHITHFSNGQSPHHHRTPGVVSAGLYSDDLHTEIIVDGVHIHKDAVKMIHKVKGASNILLITDSMRAKRMPNGNYNLGGLDVVKTDTEVRTDYGSLAGSILSMDLAVRNMIKFTDCSLNEIAQMTSYNQAKSLGIESSRGSIEEGKIADLVVLNKNLEVIMTICKGKVVYDTYLD